MTCTIYILASPFVCVVPATFDKVIINVIKNGKTSTYTQKAVIDDGRPYVDLDTGNITGPTTVTVTGYKMGKKLGTYTYNYDVKTYKPKSVHDYKLKGGYSDPQYCTWKFDVPYGDGYALAYTTDGSTPSLTNGSFISDLTVADGNYSVDKLDESYGCADGYIKYDKDGKTTFKAHIKKYTIKHQQVLTILRDMKHIGI